MTQVHDILGAITQATSALEREPGYQSRIQELEKSLNGSQLHAQQLEISIGGYKNKIDELQSKVRSLEVERDDMGFRELEAQDKLDMLRGMVMSFTCSVEAVMPKAIPIADASVAEAAPQATASPSTEGSYGKDGYIHIPPPTELPQSPIHVNYDIGEVGQSESPLPSTDALMTDNQSPPVSMQSASEQESATTQSSKPYLGRTFTSVFGSLGNQCARREWLDKGGSVEDYYR